MARPKTDFTNIACSICGKGNLTYKNAMRGENINEGLRWKWICRSCYNKDYNSLPNTHHNIVKSMTCRRMGTLNPNSSNALGDNCEELTCRWRGVDNLNIINDNYESPIDHSRDHELGIIQTKSATYNSIHRHWSNGGFRNEHNKEFDYLIFYCVSEDRIIIERIYIFPKEFVTHRKGITIMKNPIRYSVYEQYRIKDEEILKTINNIWKQIIS